MKIQLERKSTSCPNRLTCVICRQIFAIDTIRTLLYNDKGLLQGDICRKCLKLTAKAIKQEILLSANLLSRQPNLASSRTISPPELVLELLECAVEDVKFPTFYQWLIKRIEVFSQEYQEIEAARFSLANCNCSKHKLLKHWH